MEAKIWFCLNILAYISVCTVAEFNQKKCHKIHEPKLIRSCCKIPRTDDVINKCRKDLLNPEHNSPTQLEKMRNNKAALNICIAECEFKAKSYLNVNAKMDFKIVEADLRGRHPDDLDYVQLLVEGFHKCSEHARNQTAQIAWLKTPDDCDFYPATLLACATEHVYENCPPQKWHKTAACEKMRNFLVNCDEVTI